MAIHENTAQVTIYENRTRATVDPPSTTYRLNVVAKVPTGTRPSYASSELVQDLADKALRLHKRIVWPCGATEWVTLERVHNLIDGAGETFEIDYGSKPRREWSSVVRATAQIQDEYTAVN